MVDIPIKHKGTLTEFGYSSKKSAEDRKRALNRAVKHFGLDEVIRKMTAILVLNKRRPELERIYKADLRYLEGKH